MLHNQQVTDPGKRAGGGRDLRWLWELLGLLLVFGVIYFATRSIPRTTDNRTLYLAQTGLTLQGVVLMLVAAFFYLMWRISSARNRTLSEANARLMAKEAQHADTSTLPPTTYRFNPENDQS